MADGRWRMAFACGVLLLLAACREAKPPATPPAQSIVGDIDLDDIGGPNLLSLARGASIVSRTAEQTLETSAVHAIDGDWLTFWRSPPGGAEQTIVISLPARSRIDRIGIIAPHSGETPPQLRVEASDDGAAWREIKTMALQPQRDPQLATVPPFEANYLRVQTIGSAPYYTAIRSLIAKGQEIAPPKQPPIEGCWQINGMTARFTQRGSSVAGVIGSNPPMYVLGGTNGRTVRLTWLRGAMWGPAIITLDPARRALSGARWHETVREQDSGDGWFGTPCVERRPLRPPGDSAPEAGAVPLLEENEIAAAMLKRAGKWTAYGESAIDTIAALIARAPSQRFEVIVRAPAMRDALRKRGITVPISVTPAKTVTEPQRAMADGVELHAR